MKFYDPKALEPFLLLMSFVVQIVYFFIDMLSNFLLFMDEVYDTMLHFGIDFKWIYGLGLILILISKLLKGTEFGIVCFALGCSNFVLGIPLLMVEFSYSNFIILFFIFMVFIEIAVYGTKRITKLFTFGSLSEWSKGL